MPVSVTSILQAQVDALLSEPPSTETVQEQCSPSCVNFTGVAHEIQNDLSQASGVAAD